MQNYSFKSTEQGLCLAFLNNLDKNKSINYEQILSEILARLGKNKQIIFDFANLNELDTAGVCFLLGLEHELKIKEIKITRMNLSPKFESLIGLCEKNYTRLTPLKRRLNFNPKLYFIKLGEFVFSLAFVLKSFVCFIGGFFIAFFRVFKNPFKFRFKAFLFHIQSSGLKALPIVSLTAVLIGIVLTYQVAFQLLKFGANIFVVDLIGISASRELAPLITAIVIAGRSASAYTAQIGVMKITDEIAAMNTMGFKSYEFIVLPRVFALIISLPLIVAISDFIAIFGAMVVAKLSLDISWGEFLRRFKEAVELKHILIGLFKAPFFGAIIGLIACFRGFSVKNTTQSIGENTTKSVVEAIFWVIAFDALISVILTKMGL